MLVATIKTASSCSQQTRNHFWTSWHMSYWFIIGTAPPVCIFMCIYVFCLLSRVLNEFDTSCTRSELVRFHWHVSSREKTCDFTGNTGRHTKLVHKIRRIHVNWASWTREFTYVFHVVSWATIGQCTRVFFSQHLIYTCLWGIAIVRIKIREMMSWCESFTKSKKLMSRRLKWVVETEWMGEQWLANKVDTGEQKEKEEKRTI